MIALLVTVLASAALCGVYLALARRWQIIDVPNQRSSHERPTPHGGGAPAMLALCCGFAVAVWQYGPWPPGYFALLSLSLVLCGLGVVDDVRPLSARLRFAAYTLICTAAVLLLLLPLRPDPWQWLLTLIAVLALLWLVNLYNFMDGIDGIAATQCLLAAGPAALLAWWQGAPGAYPLFCLLLAACHLGFLLWNWPPARLFMGDAGSIPTGFLLGSLALLGAVRGYLPLGCWLILLALFITDATWTLLRRMLGGEAFLQAHRSHAYQRLARHWDGHLPVDFLLIAINGLWLFPLAAMAALWPSQQPILVILAFLPLLGGMAILRKLA